MPDTLRAMLAGFFTAVLITFERNIINTRIWFAVGEPHFFYRDNPWGDRSLIFLNVCNLLIMGFILGAILAFSWGALVAKHKAALPLFKMFLFAVLAMAIVGGLHDYYVLAQESLLFNFVLALWLPEFIVLFLTILFGRSLLRKQLKQKPTQSQNHSGANEINH